MPLYTDGIEAGTAFAWWQYMYNDGLNGNGIYYQIDNGSRISVEWQMLDEAGNLTHFIVSYIANIPGNITFYFLSNGDGGADSTIGVQGINANGGKLSYVQNPRYPG